MLNKTLSKTDIIDFDYFISSVDITMDNEEERQLYLKHIEPELKAGEKNNTEKIISCWLDVKRENSSRLSQGQIVNSGFRLIFILFALTGFLAGMGAAISYLSYSGTRPVNIAIYLFVFVFSQIFFQTSSIITVLSSKLNFFSKFFNTPYYLVLLLIKKATEIGGEKIDADKRLELSVSIGKMKVNKDKFGKIYFWTIFKLFQFTGLMFSTGVLIATLFKVITSDLAFGWQTTIQTAPDKIFDIVRSFSMPWSWMISPDQAYPDLKNIKGSQILLKDGIVNLVSSDMAAWWPFLCFAVLFYTIIPRILLIVTGHFFERKALKKTLRNNNSTERLIRLLTSPQMKVEKNSVQNNRAKPKNDINSAQNNSYLISGDTIIALIPEDIFSTEFTKILETKIKRKSGTISESIEITGDIDEDFDIITDLSERFKPDASGIVLIVYESWLPPIKETIDYIKTIRKHTGKSINIIVWLTGKPSANKAGYSDVDNNDFNIWNRKLLAMGVADISLGRDKN